MRLRLHAPALSLALLTAIFCIERSAHAVPRPKDAAVAVTSGSSYDRNPSFIDGHGQDPQRLFFVRTENSCDRLAGCNADGARYDLYEIRSSDRGRTWGTPVLIATNPGTPAFYGRTVAATRAADGTVRVFWASGGSGSDLYLFEQAPGSSSWSTQRFTDKTYFNVEAVTLGMTTFVYYEDGGGSGAPGIYVRTWDGATLSPATLVALDRGIPKVIVDKGGAFRMVMVRASTWPFVDVETATSADGVTYTPPAVVVVGDGTITNWDPTLAQSSDGTYHLFHAPDQGDGRQLIEHRTSRDFATWSAPVRETEGTDGTTAYWEYWPEATGRKVDLFFTSERPEGTQPAGTGHVWLLPSRR